MAQPDGYNADIQSEQLEKLRSLFPEVISEGKIDWERLKLTLGVNIDFGEKYGLSWKDKSSVFAKIQEKTVNTLHPQPEESVDWDTTQNMFIEGDNLEVLKVLHKAYYGKIKMIYIDPPYNRGKDSIYNDDFQKTRREQALEESAIDEEGNVMRDDGLRANTGGHKHSNWLDMMYPRLFLARNLLRQDGMIFVSIDDNEVHNLHLIMNEIFGEENFVADFLWKKKGTTSNVEDAQVSSLTDHTLCFRRSSAAKIRPRIRVKETRNYPHSDEEGDYRLAIIEKKDSGSYQRDTMKFEILGHQPRPGKRWQIGKDTADELLAKKRFVYIDGKIKLKIYDFEDKDTESAQSNLLFESGSTDSGAKDVEQLFGVQELFDNPKPKELISKIMEFCISDGDIILDFFAGSGTTAHGNMYHSVLFDRDVHYILVQLPELTYKIVDGQKVPLKGSKVAFNSGYENIAALARERIRRAGARISKDYADKIAARETPLDLGFRSYVFGDSNFKKWNELVIDPEEIRQQTIDNLNSLENNAVDDDLLTEILLKRGVSPLATIKTYDGFVIVLSENLAISLSRHMTEELFAQILAKFPSQIILLDQAFKDDVNLKTNLILQAEKQNVVVEML